MRARSRRLMLPAVLSVVVIGGPIAAVEMGCSSPDVRTTVDAMLANIRDATPDEHETIADAAVDSRVADGRDPGRDAVEADAAVDAAPPDTPT